MDVLFDLHEEGLRDVLYITVNRVPSPEQVRASTNHVSLHSSSLLQGSLVITA